MENNQVIYALIPKKKYRELQIYGKNKKIMLQH
jgi:hypothetical protein